MAVIISNKSGSSSATYKAPTVQTFFGGTGTYTPPSGPSPLYLKMTVVGGGGGGAGSGTSAGTTPGSGSSSTIYSGATMIITASPGIGGTYGSASGGAGGSGIVLTPGISLLEIVGQTGAGSQYTMTTDGIFGGEGGSTPLSGGGLSGFNTTGKTAIANTGSGGAGGSAYATVAQYSGGGGGASGYVQAIMPTASYTYTVGTGGAAGGAGGGATGNAGGAGADGIIIVEEFYQ